ncbi:MAG TPA: aryl-sulfate sulfotransferase [Candidatus Dormibacteraeota bacterium]
MSKSLVENQPEIVQAPDPSNPTGPPTQYWIRCLPHDFPAITATRSGAGPSPGYYLTGNISKPSGGPSLYAMILDTNGTPVWYQPAPLAPINVELLPNDTLAWSPFNGPGVGATPGEGYQLFSLDTQTTGQQPSPVQPPDLHELLQLPNGDRMEIASPVRTCSPGCLGSSFPTVTNNSFVDCVVEEVDPSGNLVWSWDAFQHIAPTENRIANVLTIGGQNVADVYHCNSIDVDPAVANPRSADVLISQRDTSAVYRINRENSAIASGRILWKLGGSSPNYDNAPVLTINNDTETTISGQHDARFESNGDVSVYDDHTGLTGPARGVQYHIDSPPRTATLDWSYAAPDGNSAVATGSFRRYAGGTDNVIGWGYKAAPMMSEVDLTGNPLLTFSFAPGVYEYRFVKVPLSAININLLRETAGIPSPSSAARTVHMAALDGPGHGASAVEVSDSSIWVEHNLGNGSLGPPQLGATNGPYYGNIGTYIADIDGQGKASAVAVDSSTIWVEPNLGNDTFGPPQLGASNGPFYGSVGTYLADIDGHGRSSAIAVNPSGVWIERNLGSDTFGPPQLASGNAPFYGNIGTYLADIDGSGRASLIAVDSTSTWIERNLGNDTFGPPQFAAGYAAFYGGVGTYVADIDGAGHGASVIAVNSSNIWIEHNLGNDSFGSPQFAAGNLPFYGSVSTAMADIDGQGFASAIAANTSNIWVERNQSNDTFGEPQQAVDSGPFYGTH